ncbi:MAG: VOC family protein [Dehalococcoidia bacterium]|nr:VOC family protein [Dehalococcoidia bacterium]
MQIKELGHIVLNVRNLDDSARFYRDQLGMCQVAEMGRALFFAGAEGRTHHELLLMEVGPDAERGKLGLNHFALRVGATDGELKDALDELAGRDLKPNRVVDHGGVTHSAYFSDPDGNTVELYIDVDPAWRPGVPEAARGLGRGGTPITL